jgi:hypothetical protein
MPPFWCFRKPWVEEILEFTIQLGARSPKVEKNCKINVGPSVSLIWSPAQHFWLKKKIIKTCVQGQKRELHRKTLISHSIRNSDFTTVKVWNREKINFHDRT